MEGLEIDGFCSGAFINNVGELGSSMPEVLAITQRHTQHARRGPWEDLGNAQD